MKKYIFKFLICGAFWVGFQDLMAQPLSVKEENARPAAPTSRKEEAMYMQPANTRAEFERNYAWRIKQTKLLDVYIPVDIMDAFRELDKKIDAQSKEKFLAMSEEQAEHKLFFSLGRWITYNWQLTDGSRLSHWFKEGGVSFPEDMTMIVVIAYHRKLNKKDINFKQLVERFKEKRRLEHEAWLKKQGIDPKTVVKPKKN